MKKELYNIEELLLNYIKENCLPKNSLYVINNDDNLFNAGVVDSAGLISFLSFIEIKFDITIPDEDLLPENFSTINKMSNYIRNQHKVSNVI